MSAALKNWLTLNFVAFDFNWSFGVSSFLDFAGIVFQFFWNRTQLVDLSLLEFDPRFYSKKSFAEVKEFVLIASG